MLTPLFDKRLEVKQYNEAKALKRQLEAKNRSCSATEVCPVVVTHTCAVSGRPDELLIPEAEGTCDLTRTMSPNLGLPNHHATCGNFCLHVWKWIP